MARSKRTSRSPVFVTAKLGDFGEGVFVFVGLNPEGGETGGDVFAKVGR